MRWSQGLIYPGISRKEQPDHQWFGGEDTEPPNALLVHRWYYCRSDARYWRQAVHQARLCGFADVRCEQCPDHPGRASTAAMVIPRRARKPQSRWTGRRPIHESRLNAAVDEEPRVGRPGPEKHMCVG